MKQLIKLNNQDDILNLLYDFDDVFPHLKEKVSDYKSFAQKLKENAFVYKAVLNDDVFGILVFYANDTQSKKAYISLIGIKKEYRSMGLGKYLMDNCVEISKLNGMKSLMLEVDNDNQNAIEFYINQGYFVVQKASDSSFYMKKDIGCVDYERKN